MTTPTPPTNKTAPPGYVYVCTACGKRSRDEHGERAITRGWDEACYLSRVLVRKDACTLDENGRVMHITGYTLQHTPEPITH